MKPGVFTVKYLLLFAAQVLLWNFCNFTPLLVIALLPVMILGLPLKCSTVSSMLIAFASGFAVDFLTGAPLGLTCLALVPVAFVRRWVLAAVFGNEIFSRGEEISSGRLGWSKMLLAAVMLNALFLLIYIIADSAGTVPLWAMIVKFIASLALSSALALPVANLLCPDSEARWR